MNPIYLSETEKNDLLPRLSLSSTAGGWVFILMGLFPFMLLALAGLGVIPTAFEWTGDEIGVFITWGLAFLIPGFWLLRQKKKNSALLNGPMQRKTAVITRIQSIPYYGWQMRLQIGEQTGTLRFVAKPEMIVGENLGLFLTENGRFFPQNPTQTVDIGTIDTPQRQRRRRWLGGFITAVFLGLILLGILVAVFDG